MSAIFDLLNSSMGKELIGGVSKQMGMNKASTASALGSVMPMILGAMGNNASSSGGAAGLLKALGGSNHSGGGMLDNLGSILGGSGIDENVMKDGGNILGHIFGGQEGNAAEAVSKASGIDSGMATNLMKAAAPFLMGYLGKQMLKNKVSDQGGLQGMLGGLLGDDNDAQKDIASKVQGFADNDDTVNGLADLITTNNKKSGGIGDLLNNMLG
ncbi:MAG: DUF937 domain-containing protein [Flavobacteriaceae bacterium]|nr:DUF937 domain-containing protein [Flavobacteriaceae bacterium]